MPDAPHPAPPTLSARETQDLYRTALAALEKGDRDGALQMFGRLIEANPRLAEPHWQVARIFADADTFSRALDHAAMAASLKPAEPAVWITWAEIVALAGEQGAELAFLDALKGAQVPPALRLRLQDRFGAQRGATRPDMGGAPLAMAAQAAKLVAQGDGAAARGMVQKLLAAHPRSAALHGLWGTICAMAGQGQQALTALRMAQKLDPHYAEAFLNEATELQRLGRTEDALRAYRAAIARAPDMEAALVRLASLLNQMDQANRARPFAERAARLYPQSLPALLALANTAILLRDHGRAAEVLEKAVAVSGGRSVEALVLLAQTLSHLNRDAEAADLIDKALAMRPDHVPALTRKASLLQSAGRFDEADGLFRKALSLAPLDGDLFRSFIVSYKVKPGDPIVDQMRDALARTDLSDRSRLAFCFAMGKALEDQKDFADAFSFIREGNDIVRRLTPYDMAARLAEVTAVKAAFRGTDWAGARIDGAAEAAPIFVTGMPRSGTTLVEQIIASHSRVTGAGELGLLQANIQRLLQVRPDSPEMRALRDIAPADIAALGHGFVAELGKRFPGADIITDKSITTYMYIGLVKLALPQARIIVVRRDPRDTLLSIYKNRFPDGTHLYAYDLANLAEHYATFVEMVDFWRQETPDWFAEVQYEDLVADPEPQSRRLIEACGLDWEDACLNFHENKRKVDTLSVYQVRQPISRGSVKAWQRYEAELAPMIDVLERRGLLPD